VPQDAKLMNKLRVIKTTRRHVSGKPWVLVEGHYAITPSLGAAGDKRTWFTDKIIGRYWEKSEANEALQKLEQDK
jgi:hypothetical protein